MALTMNVTSASADRRTTPKREQIKGREIIAIILQSFRSSDRSDMVFTIEHLIRLEYPGDKNMSVFRNKWYDILPNLRKEDTPREIATGYPISQDQRKQEAGIWS